MLVKQQQPIVNKLNPEEHTWILGLYPGCPIVGNQLSYRLVLNQLQYMPDKDVYMLCYWYDDIPFQGTQQADWVISRDSTEIKVFHKGKGHAYVIDTHNGDVNILRGGMRSHLGTSAYAFQFHMKHYYAFPLFFEKGHWANGKTPFQLGIAVPGREPLEKVLYKLYDNDKAMVDAYFAERFLNNIDLHNIDVFHNEMIEIKKMIARKG